MSIMPAPSRQNLGRATRIYTAAAALFVFVAAVAQFINEGHL